MRPLRRRPVQHLGATSAQQYFAIIDSVGVSGRSFTAQGFEQFKASYQSLAASTPAAIQERSTP